MKLLLTCMALGAAPLSAQDCVDENGFVHWESPHVHPLELSTDGSLLLAVNTPDNRLEVFDASGASLVHLFAVPVGLDPVSVRLRGTNEAWVVNHLSDSVSIVDLSARNVVMTLDTSDEPADVVFAGNPERAFVSCSQANELLVFDPLAPGQAPTVIPIEGEDPRALATSPDGGTVYLSVFESGNSTTVLGGGIENMLGYPPNVVSDPLGPYGGQNPPPNNGNAFSPPIVTGNPPAVGLIVRKDGAGQWMDDNGGNWTSLVSGPQADHSGRPVGWDLTDHDLAVVDAGNLSVSYVDRLMNICAALAVNPSDGRIALVGTDATNEVRFEPNLNGTFLRVNLALVDLGAPAATVIDLNDHLSYTASTVPQAERDKSLGDPRGVAWAADGSRAYVSGMGSNNLVVLDATGARAGQAPTIEVGEGPTGLALDDASQRLYVLNKFAGSVSVVDTQSEAQVEEVFFFDPSPGAVQLGRKHLYDTHATSGLGHVSCGSCHVDARFDRLAWDLGDPSGPMADFDQNCLDNGCEDFHPMKGPMTTQTLQDIIGKEPHHWRGDRTGIEEFNPAFEGLLGDDETLSSSEMQEFEDFLATIYYPPNPFRAFDNTLPTSLALDGHFTPGRFAPEGQPLGTGDAQRGLDLFRPPNLLDGVACVTCHTNPTGMGPDYRLQGFTWTPIAPGPDGERHHAIVSVDGSTNASLKVPQLRNLYEKVGFEATQTSNVSGFGFLHDGSVDSLARFVAEPVFDVQSDQDIADLVAFMLAYSGSDLPMGATNNVLEPPGTESQDTHAAVGAQTTLVDLAQASPAQVQLLAAMQGLADSSAVGLVARGLVGGAQRGFAYVGADTFQSDLAAETWTVAQLQAAAAPGSELTFTLVPQSETTRIGLDRDLDGFYDRDEVVAGSDPADCGDVPGATIGTTYCSPAVANSTGGPAFLAAIGSTLAQDQDLTLLASGLPTSQFGYFLASLSQGLTQNPGGSAGNLCLGGDIGRFTTQVQNSGAGGAFSIVVDTTDIPTNPHQPIAAGQTWNFQCWYRDGNTSNFTDGVVIAFQ